MSILNRIKSIFKAKTNSLLNEIENPEESLAETMLGSSDEIAEKYINKKMDIEENILNLSRRNRELQVQVEEGDGVIKGLEVKELELEAVKLQKELNSIRHEDK